MTIDEFEKLISRISYKPGIIIRALRAHDHDFIRLGICQMVPDATGREEKQILVKVEGIIDGGAFKAMGEKEALFFIKCQLKEFENHEFKEWFKLDGVCETNPHPELTKHSN